MDKYLSTAGSVSKKDSLSAALLLIASAVAVAKQGRSCSGSNDLKIPSFSSSTSASSSSTSTSSSKAAGVSSSSIRTGFIGSKRGINSLSDSASSASASDSWDSFPAISETALAIADKKRKIEQDKGLTGWKMKDGSRVYQTFRGGKLVAASGGEGFKLSMADANKGGGGKRGEKTGKGEKGDANNPGTV